MEVGLKPSSEFKSLPKTLAKIETVAHGLARGLNRLGGSANVFNQLTSAASGLNATLGAGARVAHAQASAIREATKAQLSFNNAINRMPTGRALPNVAGAVGVAGGVRAAAGAAGINAQRAASAQGVMARALLDAKLASSAVGGGGRGGGRARTGHPVIDALAGGSFDAESLLKRKVTGSVGDEKHFENVVAGLVGADIDQVQGVELNPAEQVPGPDQIDLVDSAGFDIDRTGIRHALGLVAG